MGSKVCVFFLFWGVLFLSLIQLGQWPEIKGEKETSKLLRFSHRYSFWSKFLFCYLLPGQATTVFCLDLHNGLEKEIVLTVIA